MHKQEAASRSIILLESVKRDGNVKPCHKKGCIPLVSLCDICVNNCQAQVTPRGWAPNQIMLRDLQKLGLALRAGTVQ